MSDQQPLIVLSYEDYEGKLPLLEEMPQKVARRYNEPLKYQVLASTLIRAFVKYPAIQEIHFQDDGTRDQNLSSYDLVVQGPGAKDVPKTGGEGFEEYGLGELDELLWYFFGDEEFRAYLSQCSFHRDVYLDEIHQLLFEKKYFRQQWDVSWEEYVQAVFESLGQVVPQNNPDQDPVVTQLFKAIRGVGDFGTAIDTAPQDVYKARVEAGDLDGKSVLWSPLACAVMAQLNSKNERAVHALWSCLTFTTSREKTSQDSVGESRFLKLAGPKDDSEQRSPSWVDSLALLWILSGRCAMAVNSHRSESWAKPMLEWGNASPKEADRRALAFCAYLGKNGGDSPLYGSNAHRCCRNIIDKVTMAWVDSRTPEDERPDESDFDLMCEAMLYCGGPAGMYWKHMVSKTPPSSHVRMGLACLQGWRGKSEVDEIHEYLRSALEAGSTLSAQDPHLEVLLGSEKLEPELRQKIIETMSS